MSSLILRPYQEEALAQIRRHYATGTRAVLLHMATGGGKTVIFSTIMKGVQAKGNRSVLAVRGRELVDNASQRLFREGVDHGVLMANHWNYKPRASIQVCSIDTLTARRGKQELPKADLAVIDEAHFAISPSFRWFVEHYRRSGAYMLSVTATPHVKTGLRHLADVVVYPITIRDLIAQGYLVAPKYFAPPSSFDLSGVKVDSKTGDYNLTQLSAAAEKAHVTGDVIKHYRKHADGFPAVLFACDVLHSRTIASELRAAGIPALHIDADTPDHERKEALRKLESGEIRIVCNVGILCTGVDMPYLKAVIMCRPTKSYNLFIQQIGRGTRPYPGKDHFVVLDHADNIMEHGLIECERPCNLDGMQAKLSRPTNCTCKVCYHVWDPAEQWASKNPDLAADGKRGRDYICQGMIRQPDGSFGICGHDNSPPKDERTERKILENPDSELRVIKSVEDFERLRILRFIDKHFETMLKRGYKPRWLYFKVRDKFGDEVADRTWPDILERIFPGSARSSR